MAVPDPQAPSPASRSGVSVGARPSLWPHRPTEEALSEDIESRLAQAGACAVQNPLRARRLLAEAVAAARLHDDVTVLPRGLLRAATLSLKSRDICGTYVMCLEAQPLLERLDDRWSATQVLKLRGRCFLDVGEHELAEALLSEAVDRFDKMNLPIESARCRSLLSAAYRGEGNLLAAVHFAALAREPLERGTGTLVHRLTAGEAFSRLLLARRLHSAGELQAADIELTAAAAALPHPDDVDGSAGPQAAMILDAIAMVEEERGRDVERRRALLRLVMLARRLGDPASVGLAWLRLSALRLGQGRSKAAMVAARRAIGRLSAVPESPLLPAAERLLASMLEKARDSRGAYEAFGSALRHEAEQERSGIATRLELLALHSRAEQDLRETEQTLAYAQRFSNVGYLVASINHELNQPLASIRLLAETTIELVEQGHGEEVRENLRSMFNLSERLSELASKLAAFPVRENVPTKRVALRSAIDEALAMLQSRLAQTPCEIVRLREDVHVQIDEAQVVHVIANLVNNAIDALALQSDRRIQFASAAGSKTVILTIRDNGPGIPQVVRERLFHPFFSTKAAGQGLGLGLALSRDALHAMGGDLTLGADEELGAAFDLSLPRAPDD